MKDTVCASKPGMTYQDALRMSKTTKRWGRTHVVPYKCKYCRQYHVTTPEMKQKKRVGGQRGKW